MEEIASKWDTYSSVQQSGIATSLAGVRQRVTTYSVYSVMSIGHDTDMQVKSKASHQNGEMRYAQTERHESRKNVKMVSWLNPKIPLQS